MAMLSYIYGPQDGGDGQLPADGVQMSEVVPGMTGICWESLWAEWSFITIPNPEARTGVHMIHCDQIDEAVRVARYRRGGALGVMRDEEIF